MIAGVQETANGVPALPVQEDSAAHGGAGFKGLLESVIQKAAPPAQPGLGQLVENRSPDEPEQHRNTLRSETNLQTPAVGAVMTGAPSAPVPAANQRRMAGIETTLGDGPQRPGRVSGMPGGWVTGVISPDGAPNGQPNGVAPGIAPQPLPLQIDDGSTPADAKDSKNAASSAPAHRGQVEAPPSQMAALISDGVVPPDFERPVTLSVSKDQRTLQIESGGEGIYEEDGMTPTTDGEVSQHAEQLQGHATELQKMLPGIENQQFDPVSAVMKGNAAPLPAELHDANPCTVHAQGGDHAVGASNHQKQETGGSRNHGSHSEGSHICAEQERGTGFAIDKAESGGPCDPANDRKNGQIPASRRTDFAAPQGPAAGTTPDNYVSAAVTSTAAASAQFAAQGQAQRSPAGAAPPGPSLLRQPVPAHAATAGTLTAAAESPAEHSSAVVTAATMLQSYGKAEMRVTMQTQSLGPLELHAVLDGGRLGASISVVNREAHTLLSNSLASLQQSLIDRNLRVDHLSVLNASAGGGTNTGNSGGCDSGGQAHRKPNAPAWIFSRPAALRVVGRESAAAEVARGRLSVHA